MAKPLIGEVTVAGKVFTVGEMSAVKEYRLVIKQMLLYERAAGSLYARMKDELEQMSPADRSAAVARIVDIKSSGDFPGRGAQERARYTKEGCALELWQRAKAYHQGLSLDDVQAVVTDINCEDVMDDVRAALTPPEGGDDSKS